MPRLAIVVAAFALAVVLAIVFGPDRRSEHNAAPADVVAARPGCGRTVLRDWFENARIDRTYDRECYEQTLHRLPKHGMAGTLDGELARRLATAS
jgi:hypothetical protein